MSDWTVAELVDELKAGRITRRQLVRTMVAAGLSLPVIAGVLQACGKAGDKAARETGLATASPRDTGQGFQPTKRGGGGTLKMLWWQAPVHANIHISTGTKDDDASHLATEPLAFWDAEANLFPVLAAEIPSVEKGTLDAGGRWVTWKLKKDVVWHDGKPFTAEDVVFTWEYIMDKETASTSVGNYSLIEVVDRIDDHTVKVTYKEPTPYWQQAYVGGDGHIFPKHLMAPYKGRESRNSPYNLKPVGTGPYRVMDFRPGDVIIAEINDKYHVPNRPFFDRVEMKGGGDAPSAARAVLQTGEVDYAWNLQVEFDVLESLEKNGIGRLEIVEGASTEQLQFNFADPWTEVDGERASIKTKHPFFGDLKVRQAVTLAVNRKLVVDSLYGRTGSIALYSVFNPKKYAPDGAWEFNLDKANRLLDEAGWRRGPDGVRTKDGKRLKVLYQTSVNSVRQKTQAIVKQDLEKIGFEVELKAVISDVFFSSDPGNPDTYPHFYADLQMYTTGPAIDPQRFMSRFTTREVAQKDNKWSGTNVHRYLNPEVDKLWDQARVELDPVKRTDLFKKINQITIDDAVIVPIVARHGVGAAKKDLHGTDQSTWSSDLYKLAYWYRKA